VTEVSSSRAGSGQRTRRRGSRMWRSLAVLGGAAALLLSMSTTAFAGARHAGVQSTDETDRFNVGARTTFGWPSLPQPKVDNATSSGWVGQFLSDGTFYQAGVVVNQGQCGWSCATYFAQAYDRYNNLILNWPGCGSCFGTPGTHTYAIVHGQLGQLNNWYATFDGVRYQNDDIWPPAANSGSNMPFAVAETSLAPTNGPPPDPGDSMGPFTFSNKALQTKYGSTWYDTYHAVVYFYNGVCPPINVLGWGYQSASAGTNMTGYSCSSIGSALW
jgi:hypothetical protein